MVVATWDTVVVAWRAVEVAALAAAAACSVDEEWRFGRGLEDRAVGFLKKNKISADMARTMTESMSRMRIYISETSKRVPSLLKLKIAALHMATSSLCGIFVWDGGIESYRFSTPLRFSHGKASRKTS